jgi:hypothetical protein
MSFEGPGGRPWVVYHGRARNSAARTMRIDELDWHGDGAPTVNGPTTLALPLLP